MLIRGTNKNKKLIGSLHAFSLFHCAGWQANRHSGGPYGEGERAQDQRSRKKKERKKKGEMEPDPQDPVVALVKVLEGWAVGQERQAAEHAEQMELLRVQAGLQTQALLQLAGGGGPGSSSKKPNIHLPKMSADNDAQAFLEAFEVAAEACRWPREEWVVRLLPLLSGEAQQAAHSLPPSARVNYSNLRKAMLDHVERFNITLKSMIRMFVHDDSRNWDK